MIMKSKLLAAALGVLLATGATACSTEDRRTERWATTENTNVKLDWDKVNEAYKQAEGPEDLERRINEIYGGSEIISVSVHDVDDKAQVVTGFFDRDKDGKVSDPEKIFTIRRELKGSEAQYQTQGYGAYYGYTSPFYSMASGMMMGAMMSSMFRPSYAPMYTTPYVTSEARISQLGAHRSSFRATSPAFAKPSKSGRTYGGGASKPSPSAPSRGGSRFGVAARGRHVDRLASS